MGTIGHDTLLYKLNNWQIRAAIRGYHRTHRPIYEAARMLGLWTVSCQRTKNSPTLHLDDLVKFPWETKKKVTLSEDDVRDLENLLNEENGKSS